MDESGQVYFGIDVPPADAKRFEEAFDEASARLDAAQARQAMGGIVTQDEAVRLMKADAMQRAAAHTLAVNTLAVNNPTDADLQGEFSAQKWAERFVVRVKENPAIATDEGAMTAWFASAIMAGYDYWEKKQS